MQKTPGSEVLFMQRVPTRQRQFVPNGNAAKRPQGGEASPFLRIARRIREEQGIEQLRAFLAAMVPFVAPNELKGVCTGFGLDYDSIVLLRNEQTSRQASRMNRGESASGNVNAGGMNGFMNPFGSAGGAVNGNMGSMNSGAAMNGMNSFGGMNPFGAAGGQQMQLIQMLMGMQNIMKSGKGDISRIMNMMGGR
ncbi:MAG: hypothetical protein ACLS44_08640 [Christensenellales bacterium]